MKVVTKITIHVKDTKLNLTLEEAKELHAELGKLMPNTPPFLPGPIWTEKLGPAIASQWEVKPDPIKYWDIKYAGSLR